MVYSVVDLLERLDADGLNVKIVCVSSTELFAMQDEAYQKSVVTDADELDSTFFTIQGRRLMSDWAFNPLGEQYCLCSDHDELWRTGGNLEEVLDEAHMTRKWMGHNLTLRMSLMDIGLLQAGMQRLNTLRS